MLFEFKYADLNYVFCLTHCGLTHREVNLRDNRITSVSAGAFKNLPKLKYVAPPPYDIQGKYAGQTGIMYVQL